MNKRIIVSILIGTLILFAWNVISWMVLPFHSKTLQTIPKEIVDQGKVQEKLLKSGVYHYPGLPKDNSETSMTAIRQQLKKGPRITLMVYKKGPTKLFDKSLFFMNILLNCFIVITLIFMISKLNKHTIKSILTTTLTMGLLIGLMSDLPQMNWYLFPLDYTLVNVIDHLVAFMLLGLFLGVYTFKPRQTVG
ncbi:hypothetical protein BKI52_03475 [marine bacterium AO1-C]|nr:hypothetical protein BKI52_03475 [marine bacterium AO1-C]